MASNALSWGDPAVTPSWAPGSFALPAGTVTFLLTDIEGVWRCRTVFNCTDACPRDIEITRAIEDVKRTLLFGRL